MKLNTLAMLAFLVLSAQAFAGGDVSSTIKCENEELKLTLKRKGSFFGKDWIKLSKSWNRTILDEGYEQDWSPEGATLVEQLAKKELPCSNERFYQFLESKNAFILQSYTQGSYCESKGETNTIYIQLKATNAIIKFEVDECEQSHGM